jgi:hypothetical protein
MPLRAIGRKGCFKARGNFLQLDGPMRCRRLADPDTCNP